MAVEGIAGLDIFVEHRIAFVTPEPFQLGGMDTKIHARCHGATLEAMAAEFCQREARCRGTLLDNPGDRPRVDFIHTKAGQGGLTAVPAAPAGPKSVGRQRPREYPLRQASGEDRGPGKNWLIRGGWR